MREGQTSSRAEALAFELERSIQGFESSAESCAKRLGWLETVKAAVATSEPHVLSSPTTKRGFFTHFVAPWTLVLEPTETFRTVSFDVLGIRKISRVRLPLSAV
jgi:hypothetical protein